MKLQVLMVAVGQVGNPGWVDVASTEEAAAKFTAWIDKNGYGASDMYSNAGSLRDGLKVIGRVSYNGKVTLGTARITASGYSF